jgi:hypothetical protein
MTGAKAAEIDPGCGATYKLTKLFMFRGKPRRGVEIGEGWKSEGPSLQAAGVEPYRCCQAKTIGVSTFGAGAGGLGARDPSAAAGRFVPSHHFQMTATYSEMQAAQKDLRNKANYKDESGNLKAEFIFQFS